MADSKKDTPADNPPVIKGDGRKPVTGSPGGGMGAPPAALGPETEAGERRPPVNPNDPANPQPTKGATIQAHENAAKTKADTPDREGDMSDGQTKLVPGGPVQPIRPDQTTQGSRPDVGGSSPIQTHPDNPAMNSAASIHELPTDLDANLEAARQRAGKSGNVYLVKKQLTTGHVGHVTESDFVDQEGKPNADIAWLVRSGALEPVGALRSDPKTAHSLGKAGQDEIDRLQQRINELEADNERLEKEKADLQKRLDKLTKDK